MPSALITGATGQDGWYLAELLRADGHEVFGLALASEVEQMPPDVTPLAGDIRDPASLRRVLERVGPDEIYNLAGVSSVARSWAQPELAAEVNGVGVLGLLHAVWDVVPQARVVQAGSAEIFGNAPAPQDERTPIRPTSPYGAAKALGQHAVSVYREVGLHAASTILFNHESPRRPGQFVTRKITAAAARIAGGSTDPLVLGNLDVRRDWGHARDYCRAMVLVARHPAPDDFVIATGESHSIADFVAAAFGHVGIDDWQRHVRTDPALERPRDPIEQRGDATRARQVLGWHPQTSFGQLVGEMVDADLVALGGARGAR